MPNNFRSYEAATARAAEALEAGFATKAAQKDALDDVSIAYRAVRYVVTEAFLDAGEADRTWDVPFDLHQVRGAKHAALFGAEWNRVALLVDLRAAIKGAEIKRVENPNKAEVELKGRVIATIEEEMARIGAQYAEAIDLGRTLKGLPVTARTHYVTNEFGTTFLRTFWFLNGKMVRFNVIAAAYEALIDEGAI